MRTVKAVGHLREIVQDDLPSALLAKASEIGVIVKRLCSEEARDLEGRR